MTTSNQLLAGVSELDITPPLGTPMAGHFKARLSEEIQDPLLAKALVLDDGKKVIAFVVLDLISLPAVDVAAIRELVEKRIGIPESHVMISCTHTHTGPVTRKIDRHPMNVAYCEWMRVRVADTIQLAWKRRQPAKIGIGSGEQRDLSFCRRYRMKDGTVVMNPERGDPNIVEPVSPIDPLVGVLYAETLEGKPLAVMGRFSLHYVGTDNALAISADYYGHFATEVRKMLESDCMVMLANGNSAQINAINPLDLSRPRGSKLSWKTARALASEVVKVIGCISLTEDVSVDAVSKKIVLKRKKLTEQDVKLAEAIMEQVRSGKEVDVEGNFQWVVGAPLPKAYYPVYAEGNLRLANVPEEIESEVQCLKVGNAAWVGLPGEIFVEIGDRIQEISPTDKTYVLGLTNDSLGYFPTNHAFQNEGGYETWATAGNPVGPSEDTLVEASLECLKQLF